MKAEARYSRFVYDLVSSGPDTYESVEQTLTGLAGLNFHF